MLGFFWKRKYQYSKLGEQRDQHRKYLEFGLGNLENWGNRVDLEYSVPF